ncbi:homeobox-leucine zipper protein ATHB-40-like protein [Tanacetum coccineum]
MEHGKFTTEKVITLEQHFELSQNPEKETKVRLASQLGLDLQEVVVWFQNRRARWKHEEEHSKLKNELDSAVLEKCRLETENASLKTEVLRLKERLAQAEAQKEINSQVNRSDAISSTRNFLGDLGWKDLEWKEHMPKAEKEMNMQVERSDEISSTHNFLGDLGWKN